MRFQKIPMGKVDKWLVDEAKKFGLDIDGFEHEITNEFVNHVMNEHGNEKTEKSRGQIAIKQEDFNKIPDIVKSPDYVIFGGKYTKGESKDKNFLAYAKKLDDGTTLFYEVVLDSKNNRSLRGKTMYKLKGAVNEQKFIKIASNADDVDLSNAKTISLAAAGGCPGLIPTTKESAMAASPIKTQGLSTFNIPQSGEKSSEIETLRNAGNVQKADLSGAKIVLGYGSQPVMERKPERAHHPAAAKSAIPQDASNIPQSGEKSREIEAARKAGYVQGVCECVAAIGDNYTLGKKLLSEMNVTKDIAKKFANPETYKTLEKGIFAQKPEQKTEQKQGVKR